MACNRPETRRHALRSCNRIASRGARPRSLKQKLIDLSFKRDQDGRTIAYLYGRTGYVVPDAATEARLRDLKWRLVVAQMLPGIVGMLVGLVTPGLAYGWAIALWCALLLLATLVDLCLRAAARKATRGLATAAPMELADAFQRIRAAFPRLWRGYMWCCLASAHIIFLGSVAYLAMGTWIMGHVLAVGGIVLSACMLAGGACGLRGWPHARTR